MLDRIDIENISTEKWLSNEWTEQIFMAAYKMISCSFPVQYSDIEIDFRNPERINFSTYLDDGKYYSKVILKFKVYRQNGKYMPIGYSVEFTPFTVELYPIVRKYSEKCCKSEEVANLQLTKYLKKFLTEIYGEEYVIKFNRYYERVKNNKIKKFSNEIDEKYEDLIR